MYVETRQTEEWELVERYGRVLVAAGRVVGEKRVKLTVRSPDARIDAPTARALAAWLLVQASDMDEEAEAVSMID